MAALIADKLRINSKKKTPSKLFIVIVEIAKTTPISNNNNSKMINKKRMFALIFNKLITKRNSIKRKMNLFNK